MGASYWLGKKFYNLLCKNDGEVMKIRGVPLKTIDDHGNTVKVVTTQLYEDVYAGKSVECKFASLKKCLFKETYISAGYTTRTVRGLCKYEEYS